MESQKTQIAKTILSKNSSAGGITIPNFKLNSRVIFTNIAWYGHKNRHVDQWNAIENLEISPFEF
jgi:hypothetical protein